MRLVKNSCDKRWIYELLTASFHKKQFPNYKHLLNTGGPPLVLLHSTDLSLVRFFQNLENVQFSNQYSFFQQILKKISKFLIFFILG